MLLNNMLSASPLLFMFSSLFAYLFTDNLIFIKFFIYLIFIFYILTPLSKNIFQHYFSSYQIFNRPNPPLLGCGLFPNNNVGSKSFGMPSGHAIVASFTFIFWYQYLISSNLNYIYPKIFLLFIWCLIILIQRIVIGCHNLIQIIIGVLIGLSLNFF